MTGERRLRNAASRQSPAIDFVTCQICGKSFRAIKWPHLVAKHGFDQRNSVSAYKRRFGLEHSWSEATIRKTVASRAATLERQGKLWTPQRVKREIRERHKNGLGLSQKAMRGVKGSLEQEARRFFGGWYEAVAAAGIDPATVRIRVRWTPNAVVERIRLDHRKGLSLRSTAVRRRYCALGLAGRRYFGTWEASLTAAGLSPSDINARRTWNRARVLAALRALRPFPLEGRALAAKDYGLYRAVHRYLGGWGKAVRLVQNT